MKHLKVCHTDLKSFLTKKNVTFINDSKATSFIAAQSALSSLKNIYWILGGLPKKMINLNFPNVRKMSSSVIL